MNGTSDTPVDSSPYTFGRAQDPLPFLGHIWQLWCRPLDFLCSLPEQGDLIEFRLGLRPAYIACHPDLTLQILMDPRTYDKGGPLLDKVRKLLGDGLATSSFERHLYHRRLLQPVFHISRMPRYTSVICEEIATEVASWTQGSIVDISKAMFSTLLRITTRLLFATSLMHDSISEVVECVPIIMHGTYRGMITPEWWGRLPTAENRRYNGAQLRLRKIIARIIGEHRKNGADQGDMLSVLVSATDPETGNSLSDQDIHDQVMTMLIAGTETTGNALAWAFYSLAQHPLVEQQLYAELDTVLGGRMPSFDDLPKLTYTGQIFTETLRMYPPGWLFSRLTTRDTKLAGRTLPAGTSVFYSPYMIGRNPALFKEPEQFAPDRWNPDRAKLIPRGAMIAFGAGNRKCIGDNLAGAEGPLILATVASRWRLRLLGGTKPTSMPKLTLETGPLPMMIELHQAKAA